MPYAESAETARRWATTRAIDLWVIVAGDLADHELAGLNLGLVEARQDGAQIALAIPPGVKPSPREELVAAVSINGSRTASPFDVFAAMQVAGVVDVRQVGVLGASRSVLDAGHRAGAGAIVGVTSPHRERVHELLLAQPDAIVAPAGFADLDRERYAGGRAHRQRVLLNPGPAVVTDRIHRAVAGPDLCHREPEYNALFDRLRAKLLRVAGVADDWALVLIAGSGTAAMEAMTGASVRPGKRLLVCCNGIYGQRIATIADRLGIATVLVSAPDLVPIDPGQVAAALDTHDDIDAVAVIHHETTTGLLNPVEAVAGEAKRRGVLVLVDAISSLGAEELDLSRGDVDMVASSSNKCLHGLPGCSFLLVSPAGQARVHAVAPRSLYFDLQGYLTAQEKGTVPFTPATPALYGLEAALDELFEEGAARRRAHYQARMDYLDRALPRLGLEPRVAAGHRSRSVRSLPLPPGVDYQELHDALKAEGYVVYGGLGAAARTTFRVCALGALSLDALAGFVAALERTLRRLAPTPAVESVDEVLLVETAGV